MKAMIYTEYGTPEVLQLRELDRPLPGEKEVLIAVRAAGVNVSDLYAVKGEPLLARLNTGLLRPRHGIPGADVAGVVEAVGGEVTRFRPGDAVFGDLSAAGRGAFAEYAVAPESALARMPANLTFEQAAAVPLTGVTALQGLRRHGALEAGQQVLVNGASGGVGTFAVQIARALGARVTGVGSSRNVELMRAIGADQVVDYTQEDFTAGRRRYDLVFDTVANHPAGRIRSVLRPTGRYVSTAVSMGVLWLGPWLRLTGRQRMHNMMARPNPEDLLFLAQLLGEGKVVPVIDRCYPLDEAADGLRYLEKGHTRGKVVIGVTTGVER